MRGDVMSARFNSTMIAQAMWPRVDLLEYVTR